MKKEKESWEAETKMMTSTMSKPPSAQGSKPPSVHGTERTEGTEATETTQV